MCREGSDESESRESVNKQFPEGRGDTAKGIRRPLTYVNDTAPEFELYQYAGEHYEAMVPDTYDVAERAEAVQNVLTRATDPEWDYQVYFRVDFARNPAIMWHGIDDWCQQKYMQSLPLIRLITGDESNREVEQSWLEAALKQIGPDGLNYFPRYPFEGGDWLEFLDDPTAEHYASSLVTYIAAFAVQQLLQPNDLWLRYMRRQVDAMTSLAVDEGDWAYLPFRFYSYEGPRHKQGGIPLGGQATHAVGFLLQGLGLCYRIAGYEPAGELARKLCYFLKDHAYVFDAEGRFLPDTPPVDLPAGALPLADAGDVISSHFHSRTACLLNMLEYALPANDYVLLEFIKKSFEWARRQGEQTLVAFSTPNTSAEYAEEWHLGYFPERLFATNHEEAETCEVADMIGIGLKLSATGVGDYWDDVDQWIRNQFAENQLMDTGWLHEFVASCPPRDEPLDELTTDEDVIERNRGAFAGWALPNAWMGEEPHYRKQIMHCCTANGARAIYYIWEHILHHESGKLRVNLLLNRVSQWADIASHIPYQGQVDIRIKQPVDLQVRIPGWAALKQVRCTVSGNDRPTRFDGRYLQVGRVQPGDSVTVSFPIAETKKLLEIEKHIYNVVLRGADVVKIDPPGVLGPFYQRAHYRTGQTCWRKVARFVPSKIVQW